MKKNILLITLFNFFLCNAQIVTNLSDIKQVDIDTVFVKEHMHHQSFTRELHPQKDMIVLSEGDIDTMQVITILHVKYDTLSNNICFEADTTQHIVYFLKKDAIFSLDKNGMRLMDTKLSFRLNLIVFRNLEYIYYIPSLFDGIEEHCKEGVFYFKLKRSPNIYFSDANSYIYTSWDDLLEYKFGSVENYKNIYNIRLRSQVERIEKFKEFISNNPMDHPKIKLRIRGGE